MKGDRIISKRQRRQRGRRRPLDVQLTLKMNLGKLPGDAVTLVDDRRVPLVGSVFENRNRIAREFLRLLAGVALRRPGTVGDMFPLPFLRRR